MTNKQLAILRKLAQGSHSKLHHKQRATMILLYFESNKNISQIAKQLQCSRTTVRKWRDRWHKKFPELIRIEKEKPHALKSSAEAALEDAYRCGSPGKFTPEQIVKIVTMVLEKTPKDKGIPATHWTLKDIADKVVEEGYVTSISTSKIHKILDSLDIKPHKCRQWLNPKIEDKKEFDQQVRFICTLYKSSEEFKENGTEILSTDEMTGIQALHRTHPNHPMEPGKEERSEFEYERHGTTGMIASRFVTSGQVIATVQQTRKEKDFVQHVKEVVAQDDTKQYIFIVDQLNTHKSDSLVLLWAELSGIDPSTLGVKGKSGILKSMKTRAEFLSNPERKVRFVYVPRHCSWLNQIEIWFSIIKRRILNRRASFKSVQELEQELRNFIEHYNLHLAKPFNWKYGGKVLKENEAKIA